MQAERFDMSLAVPRGGAPRSPGVHVSNLIRGLAVQSGILKIKDRLDDLQLVEVNQGVWWEGLDPASRLRISIGLAWEQWYLGQLSDILVDHPGEMHLDGIYLTHDAESLDLVASECPNGSNHRYVRAVHEVKATYKSTNTVVDWTSPKNWLWKMQIMAYCKALNTTLGWAHILHLAGSYSYPIEPVGSVWRLQFTQEEIDDAWDRVTGYRDARLMHEAEIAMKDTTNATSDRS